MAASASRPSSHACSSWRSSPTAAFDLFHSTADVDEEALLRLRRDAQAAGVRLHLLLSGRDGRLTGERLRNEILDLWDGGQMPTQALLVVSHNIEEAVMMADRVLVFGGLTIWLQDDTFIKLKPTIVNCLFAVILGGGLVLFKKPLLKPQQSLPVSLLATSARACCSAVTAQSSAGLSNIQPSRSFLPSSCWVAPWLSRHS